MTADTAEVLLRQYMERFTNFYRGAASPASAGEAAPPSPPLKKPPLKKRRTYTRKAPVKAKRKINYPATRKPAEHVHGALSEERRIIYDYVGSHTGPFRTEDLIGWATQKGLIFDRAKMQRVLYNAAHEKKSLTSNGRGEYTRV
jgi:hypothetical protein